MRENCSLEFASREWTWDERRKRNSNSLSAAVSRYVRSAFSWIIKIKLSLVLSVLIVLEQRLLLSLHTPLLTNIKSDTLVIFNVFRCLGQCFIASQKRMMREITILRSAKFCLIDEISTRLRSHHLFTLSAQTTAPQSRRQSFSWVTRQKKMLTRDLWAVMWSYVICSIMSIEAKNTFQLDLLFFLSHFLLFCK